jgi:hypothetical protein
MTQTEAVLELLRAKPEGITALEALQEVGTMRLAARIADLRRRGYVITTDTVKRGRATVGLYRLREQLPLWGTK